MKEHIITKAIISASNLGDHFTENDGQLDNSDILFYINGRIGFTKNSVIFIMQNQVLNGIHEDIRCVIYELHLEGSNDATPVGIDVLPHQSNYFIGKDPSKWVTGVRSYASIMYPNIYDGIDLIYRLKEGALKYDFIVYPGADPNEIRMSYEGIEGLTYEADSSLRVSTQLGELHDSLPYIYQDIDGTKREISGGFKINEDQTYGFEIDKNGYESSQILVIDPELEWSTFLGDVDGDFGYAITLDGNNDIYLTGFTYSPNFPWTPGAYDIELNGTRDVFISKLSGDGTTLLNSTFLGGDNEDWAAAIDIDPAGDVYISGETKSDDFPVTAGAIDESFNGLTSDGFVAKLSGNLSSLIYCTYLGGDDIYFIGDAVTNIVVDSDGYAYVTGYTDSPDFPWTPGAYDTVYDDNVDAFVAKINQNGSALNFSTFIGGNLEDNGYDIALGTDGNITVSGDTKSTDFPTTSGAYAEVHNGSWDEFVLRLNANGSALIFSTFIGGNDWDGRCKLELDSENNVYIAGHTESDDFPTTSGAIDSSLNGILEDAFVAKLSSDGSSLLYSTYLGGTDKDFAYDIAVDPSGDAIVTGSTKSDNFPTTPDANDTSFNGLEDVFLTRINHNASKILYSTYLGTNHTDRAYGLALGLVNEIYVVGYTNNTTFPVTSGVYDPSFNGDFDAIVVKFNISIDLPPIIEVWEPGGTSGQIYTQGDLIVVLWNASDNNPLPPNPINISYGSLSFWTIIANNEPNDGMHIWNTSTVPCPGTYWMNVSVYDSAGKESYDLSNYSFNITCPDYPPLIEVWEPGGTPSQTYTQGDFITIIWNANDDNSWPNSGNVVNISYGAPGTWTSIVNFEQEDGTYIWNTTGVPCPNSYVVNISVYDSIGQGAHNYSNYTFLIDCPIDNPPVIEAWEPGGAIGQVYNQGDLINITWNASDDNPLPLNPINISYGNASVSWTTIAYNEANDGVYEWNTSNVPCPGIYWMNLTVYDSIGQTIFDLGNYSFEIICLDDPPIIEAWEPGGIPGQVYTQGDMINVTWNASDDNPLPANPINISYGNVSFGWISIVTNEANDGFFEWNTSSVFCPGIYWMNISISDSIGQTAFDLSNYSFNISCPDLPPTIEVWEPGGMVGQTYTQGDIINVTWNASDDNPWPNSSNVVNISYGTAGSWTSIVDFEQEDGSYLWNTTGVPCGYSYFANISVYDSIGQIVYDLSNFTFEIICPNLPPIINVWEPGGSPGQTYTKGEAVNVTWNATDDYTLPLNPINISYGNLSNWLSLSNDEENDGTYSWDTSDVLCPGTYWMNLSVYDSSGKTTFDQGNYSFNIVCPPTHPPEITNQTAQPDHQTVGNEVTISATVTDPDTSVGNLTVKVLIINPNDVELGNFTMVYNTSINKFVYVSTYDLIGNYTFVIWANDNDDHWDSASGSFVMDPETVPAPAEEFNWKPVIALIFTIILLIVGLIASRKRPIEFKGDLQKDRLYTFLYGTLPFVLAEAITGVVSIFTDTLDVPPVTGLGMIIDLVILIIGIIVILALTKKGKKPSTYPEQIETEKAVQEIERMLEEYEEGPPDTKL